MSIGTVLPTRGHFRIGEHGKRRPLSRCFSTITDPRHAVLVFQGPAQGCSIEVNEEFAREIINELESCLSRMRK